MPRDFSRREGAKVSVSECVVTLGWPNPVFNTTTSLHPPLALLSSPLLFPPLSSPLLPFHLSSSLVLPSPLILSSLLGYARIVLALLAFYLMPCCPVPAVFFYLLSALLDAFDGHAARALNQGTTITTIHVVFTL